MDERESFLERWSRLKRARADAGQTAGPAVAAHSVGPAVDEAALEELGAGSDFARFLAQGVDPDLRARALRILWDSEPDLATGDGLIDYAADYTGTGGGEPGTFMSAYRIGRGLLSDDEAALWAALGEAGGSDGAPGAADRPDGDRLAPQSGDAVLRKPGST